MYQGGSGPSHGQIDLIFSASANNSLYSQETVQPLALQTLIIIKIWKAGHCNFVPEYSEDDRLAEKLA